jgi:hypothetical protein
MPQAQMLTKNYERIIGPVRLGNTIYIGEEYFKNNSFKIISADIVHEQMAHWVAEKAKDDPGLGADAHSLGVSMEKIVAANKALDQDVLDSERSARIIPPNNAPGGIDFRRINFTPKPMPNITDRNIQLDISSRAFDEVAKKELSEINRLVKAKIIPSSQRIKECLQKTKALDRQVCFKQLNNSLAEIFMLEEEYQQPSDNSFVNLLQLVVSNN